MQSPPFPRYLVNPRSKYSPQHHVLKHLQLPFLPQCQRPSFTPIQKKRPNYSSTTSDSKLMRMVPKKSFILFIHELKYVHLQSTCLVPAHTFSSDAGAVCSIPGTQLEECCLTLWPWSWTFTVALELDIYSLAHHLCKIWIFYEPRRVALGNTRHFVEE